jgi:serine/threonine-protein kinase
MGEVYVAEQTGVGDFKKSLALKLLLPGLDSDEKHVRLFLSEARIASRLTHPNIVQVFDAGRIEERYFLAMELVDGVSLGELIGRLQKSGPPPSAQVISLVARQVLEALSYAHELRDDAGSRLDIVHRDISPSNILLSKHGEVKLTDFGIAKVRGDEGNTAPGEVRGKLAYIAPEVLRGASASQRSDLYAVGVTLYRLAALASPFSGAAESDPISAVVRGEKTPLTTVRPDLPAELVFAIEKSMSLAPADRFESAAAMREAFPRGNLEAQREALIELLAIAPPPPVPVGTAPFALPDLTATEAAHGPQPTPERRGSWLVGAAVAALAVAGLGGWWLGRPTQTSAPTPSIAPSVPPPSAVLVEKAPPDVELPAAAPALPEPAPARPPKPLLAKKPTPKAQVLSPPALLSIQAKPWANVEINGKAVGQTPIGRFPVTTPLAVIRLTNPGLPSLERRLKLSAGEEYKVNEDLSKR